MKGGYRLENIAHGEYIILVSCLGYIELRQDLTIAGEKRTFNAELTEKAYDIDEVAVQASRMVRSFEKTSYAITPSERSRAANSFELLRTIPTLKIDPVSKSVTPIVGGGGYKS